MARFDEVRADGATFSFAVLAFVLWTLLRRGLQSFTETWLLLLATLAALLPLALDARGPAGWSPALGGLADRAPLFSAWSLAWALASWRDFDWNRLWWLIGGGTSLASLFAIPQAFGWNPPGWEAGPTYPSFPFPGIIHAVEVVLPMGLILLAHDRARPRAPWRWAVLLPMAFHVGLIGSNAGRLGLLLGAGWLLWKKASTRRTVGLWLVLVLLGELTRALFAGDGHHTGDILPQAGALRPSLYQDALVHAASHPLGSGLGRFESDFPSWRSEETARLLSFDWSLAEARTPKTVHSEPLMLLLEAGWLGAVLVTTAAFLLLRRIRNGSQSALLVPAALALTVSALVRSPLTDNATSLALAALMFGAALATSPTPSAAAASRGRNRTSVLCAVGLAGLAAWPAWPQLRGEQALSAALMDDVAPASHLVRATEVRPWDKQSWVLLATYYMAGERWEWSRRCLEQALLHDENHLPAVLAYLRLERISPDAKEERFLLWLRRAEMLGARHPVVLAHRQDWLIPYRDAFQQEAVRRVQAGIPGAGPYWAASYLAEAQLAAIAGKPEEVRAALFQAASVVPRERATVERLARQGDAAPSALQDLARRVFPNWPTLT